MIKEVNKSVGLQEKEIAQVLEERLAVELEERYELETCPEKYCWGVAIK